MRPDEMSKVDETSYDGLFRQCSISDVGWLVSDIMPLIGTATMVVAVLLSLRAIWHFVRVHAAWTADYGNHLEDEAKARNRMES